eukprot:4452957-Prymnesium_polylepis.1
MPEPAAEPAAALQAPVDEPPVAAAPVPPAADGGGAPSELQVRSIHVLATRRPPSPSLARQREPHPSRWTPAPHTPPLFPMAAQRLKAELEAMEDAMQAAVDRDDFEEASRLQE